VLLPVSLAGVFLLLLLLVVLLLLLVIWLLLLRAHLRQPHKQQQ
jgi:hypothetical protein